jgi:RHS repeat-associated protein
VSSGTDPQVLSLPKGGGAVSDVGTAFETDLNTGTGSYAFPLTLPAGPDGVVPSLRLRYSSGAGNGPFGIGWAFGSMAVQRATDHGVPSYAPGADAFAMPGVDDLIDVGGGAYRPRVDTMFYRILRKDAGWEVTDTAGTVYALGASAAARVATTIDGSERVGAWLLETMTTAAGDVIAYTYAQDDAQRYVSSISWGRYRLDFVYESRPDRLSDGSFGFLIRTAQRCARIELHALDAAPTLVRSWNLSYTVGEPAGLSLLASITVRGHGADGATLDAPPTAFGYTTVAPRTLTRSTGLLLGASPPPFSSRTVELVDWDGDGLPELFEMRAGMARVWRNNGRNRWGYPLPLPAVPGPVDLAAPGVAFADLLGTGTVDLVAFASAASRYVPLREGGGFGRAVTLNGAPPVASPGLVSRFMDLDGDGRADVLTVTDEFFALYYRTDDGFSAQPQTIPRSAAPAADLRDPHVKLADMTGDGLQDLVRVDGAAVRYWPYLGYGRWAEPVEMTNPPVLPRGYDPNRLFVVDVDGDGCADFVYVDAGSVTVWYNRGGVAVGPPQTIAHTPAVGIDEVRLVDFNGTGTTGVLWSNVPDGPSRRGYVYLDLCGGVKPYLLATIDNGIGTTSTIAYRSSTEFALDAAEAGTPWRTFHPFPVHCVSGMSVRDAATGVTASTRYVYGPARYDSAVRAFLGFGVVDTITAGDASVPGQRARNTYHLGLDPADLGRPLAGDDVLVFGALRRRLLKTELFGLDGGPDEAKPYRVVTHAYAARIEAAPNGARIGVGYETLATETLYERAATPFSTHTISYAVPDSFGNIGSQRMVAQRTGIATPDLDVTTATTFAQNVAAHVVSLPARVTQTLADGTIASAKVMYYDGPGFVGLPEGQATVGQLTRTDVLAFTDPLVGAIYGAHPPDPAALGYLRHAGESGWWIRHVAYARDTAAGILTLTRRSQLGFDARIVYDATRSRPERMIDELGNTIAAAFDERALQMGTLTDGAGATSRDTFDLLGRVTGTISPGDSAALPSIVFGYELASAPTALRTSYRTASGSAATFDEVEYFDGRGQRLAGLVPGEGDAGRAFIVRNAVRRNVRGLEAELFEPYYADDASYHAPPLGTPATTIAYDGLGRLLVRSEPGGAITRYAYGPGTVTISNALAGETLVRTSLQHLDALGRVVALEQQHDGRTVRQTFTYTAQSHIATSTDADGITTVLSYDLLGRLVANATPATGTTLSVADAAGNVVVRRNAAGEEIVSTFDGLGRLLTTSLAGAPAPEVTYHYLNAGDPAPPDGERNRRSRLWRVDDALGTWTYTYDARGQIVGQTRTLTDRPGITYATDFVLDDMGRQLQTTLPEPLPGAGRRVVSYTYGPRGVPVAAPSYVKAAEYDLRGRLTALTYQNGTRNTWTYLPNSRRLQHLAVADPGGQLLRDQTFQYDGAANTTGIASPNPLEQATFGYDDLDRLTAASYGDGNTFAYAYSDGGTVQSAGPDPSTFDAAGRMIGGAFGALAYDGFDRLTGLTRPDATVERYAYDFRGMRGFRAAADGTTFRSVDASLELVDARAIVWVTFGGRRIVAFGPQASYVHYDQLGNATLFTDGAGAELRRLAFGPYGSLRHDSRAGDVQPQFGPGTLDAATGLVCMGRRYLDPLRGRFVSPDMIVGGAFTLDGWNRYAYARNNPLRYVDPSGMISWQNVLAVIGIVILIAVLCVAAYFTGGTTLLAIPGLTVTLGGLFVSAAVGVAAGAVIGGIAAAQAGGDIWKGILFGGIVGGIAGFASGALGLAVASGMSSLTFLGSVAIGAVEGAVIGAGTGAAVGFAGGKGNAESIFKHMLAGFITGAVVGAALGAVSGIISGEGPNAALKIGTLDKYSGAAGPVSTSSNVAAFGQNTAELVAGGNPLGLAGSFVGIGQSAAINSVGDVFNVGANGAIISIPVGWVPQFLLANGGVVALEGISSGLDASGTYSFGNQLVLALSLVPFVGIAFGYGTGQDTSWEASFESWLDDHFSQSSANAI